MCKWEEIKNYWICTYSLGSPVSVYLVWHTTTARLRSTLYEREGHNNHIFLCQDVEGQEGRRIKNETKGNRVAGGTALQAGVPQSLHPRQAYVDSAPVYSIWREVFTLKVALPSNFNNSLPNYDLYSMFARSYSWRLTPCALPHNSQHSKSMGIQRSRG
ncbi:hypothetical protein BDBG_01128 [Blastomyces gilchristii SLH14081]|uniref:Uncharacterized protein n=1 Tax=Blastomyces gilchristii (strain SLH14081) TaxID=559298 RepID=A0A179U9F5_BLAGS|nr:uncharacterized protein BDBG_01128 [Blastomyces gilchristii SLH14081]EQL28665.1 hypothetical protein BDFG_08623 [Blastomyces dermatitidis ATCC 26199]OAT04604.1 hypothetical protein BDBG_01128 [Blastomyces gilchristii SLH14081]